MEKIYWTMKNGEKIDVDEMNIKHLRNTLKMILRNRQKALQPTPKPKVEFRLEGDMANFFNEEETCPSCMEVWGSEHCCGVNYSEWQ